MAIAEWIYDKSYEAWYYLKSDGIYAYDQEVNGYYLESDGKMRESWVDQLRRELDGAVQSQRQ